MSKAKARVFVPLTKVDEDKRLVYGTITQEVLDKSGEVMDYDTSKPLFEKWSNDIHEASGGLSKGNLRVMHGLTVAGKLTDINFDDAEKSIDVCSKVVDDAEWNKVLEGCYTGFSVGGSYAKRWSETDPDTKKKVKKFTAQPNEVSLVDNPCVPSATFSLVKADGAEEQIEFKVENDDDLWPDFSKAADAPEGTTAEEPAPAAEIAAPTNDEVVAHATELAKAAGDGTTWMDHVVAARDALTKTSALSLAVAQVQEQKEHEKTEGSEKDDKPAAGTGETETSDDVADADTSIEKVTPAGVKQVWTSSDGKTFDKKADAETHEATLAKAEPTDAEKLAERLSKASTQPAAEETSVEDGGILSLERVEDLHKAVLELELPREEDGAPKLEKGMYTVSRFANMLGDVAGLARTIKAEGKLESDSDDESVAKNLVSQLGTFGDSFMRYAKQQIAELVAGLDTDLSPRCAYDYYYRCAQADPENSLAKNVCELIEAVEDEREEAVEKLAKFAPPVDTDDLPEPLKKRFEALEGERDEFRKVAEDAVSKVEELSKRVDAVENTPLPRAPRDGSIAHKEGDNAYFGKAVTSDADKMNVLKELLDTHGPDGMATMMIKAAQQNGQSLQLKG